MVRGYGLDPGAAAVASLVQNLKRDLGRRGRAKGTSNTVKPSAPVVPSAPITGHPA